MRDENGSALISAPFLFGEVFSPPCFVRQVYVLISEELLNSATRSNVGFLVGHILIFNFYFEENLNKKTNRVEQKKIIKIILSSFTPQANRKAKPSKLPQDR